MTFANKCIESESKDSKGKLLWLVGNDGRFFLSATVVKEAAISKAHIKS